MTFTPKLMFVGGRADSVTLVAGTLSEITTASSYDSTYADCGLQISGADGYFDCAFTDATGAADAVVADHTCYFHCELFTNDNATNSGRPLLTWYDSSGNPWLRVREPFNGGWGFQYNSGTAGAPVWTAIANTSWSQWGNRRTVDVVVTIGATGNHTVQLVLDGTAAYAPAPFTQASFTNVAKIRVGQVYSGSNVTAWSQMIATQDLSTVTAKVKTLRANGAGSNAGWTGTQADVNEVGTSDATYNAATSAGLVQTYAMSDVTVPAGLSIKAVRHCMRARNQGAGSPSNIQSVVRSSGANYTSGNLPGVTTAFGPTGKRYETDPATGAPWTQAAVNAVELGYASAA